MKDFFSQLMPLTPARSPPRVCGWCGWMLFSLLYINITTPTTQRILLANRVCAHILNIPVWGIVRLRYRVQLVLNQNIENILNHTGSWRHHGFHVSVFTSCLHPVWTECFTSLVTLYYYGLITLTKVIISFSGERMLKLTLHMFENWDPLN